MKSLSNILIICLLVLFTTSSFAQKVTIKGRITETNTSNGVSYTNIGVEGTYLGCATDEKGYFSLDVPQNYLEKKVMVSAIGYTNKTFVLKELTKQDFVRISLNKEIYSVDAVDIIGQSMVAFRVVNDAIKSTGRNYHNKALGLDYHFVERTTASDSTERVREAIVELTDNTAYATPSIENAFAGRNYRFVQVNKNFKVQSFPEALSNFDELIGFDVVRMGNTIFDIDLTRDYDLKVDDIAPYENDSVWIISYRKNEPGVLYSYDYYANSIEGKLYILKSNNALVRHELHVVADKNSLNGRHLYTQNKNQQKVDYQVLCMYKQYNGKYLLSYLSEEKHYTDELGKRQTQKSKMSLLKLKENAKQLTSRSYFEDVDFDRNYWTQFHKK